MNTQQTYRTVPPEAARVEAKRLFELQQEAKRLLKQSDDTPKGSGERTMTKVLAKDAQAKFNQGVEEFGKTYHAWFETGRGSDGWGYIKRRSTRALIEE